MRDVDTEQALAKANRRVGEWLAALEAGAGLEGLPGGRLVDIRIRQATEDDPMVLLVVRASAEGERYVAFVGAGNTAGALLAWRKRCQAAGLKWRVDLPWEKRGVRGVQ